jgi:biopolymer transport protein ExbB
MIDWTGIGKVAIGVIVTLFLMSVMSLAVTAERYWALRRSVRQSRRFALEVSRLLRSGKLREAAEWCRSEPLRYSYLARSLGPGLEEWLGSGDRHEGAGRESVVSAVKEAIQNAAFVELSEMKRGLAALATIGSTAPFVGLFGTTFGIIDCFKKMGMTGSGGIGAISQGIAEALITTAFGLFVAVPAVWAYNYFSGRLERIGVEIERSGHELVSFLSKS